MIKIKSRKLAVFTIALVTFMGNYLMGSPIPEEQIHQVMVLVVGWLVAQGVADAGAQGQINAALRAADQGKQVLETVKQLSNDQAATPATESTSDDAETAK